MSRTRTATHEAGHAVAGHIQGIPFHSVTMHSDTSGQVAGYVDELPVNDRGLESVIIDLLAGAAALMVARDPDPWGGADGDLRRARGVAQLLDREDPERVITAMLDRAVALCHAHWAAIERFAATLEAHNRLAGEDLRLALRAAFGGAPMPRLDAGGTIDFHARRRSLFEGFLAHAGELTDAERAEAWDAAEAEALGIPRLPASAPPVAHADVAPAALGGTAQPGWWNVGAFGREIARQAEARAERAAASEVQVVPVRTGRPSAHPDRRAATILGASPSPSRASSGASAVGARLGPARQA